MGTARLASNDSSSGGDDSSFHALDSKVGELGTEAYHSARFRGAPDRTDPPRNPRLRVYGIWLYQGSRSLGPNMGYIVGKYKQDPRIKGPY